MKRRAVKRKIVLFIAVMLYSCLCMGGRTCAQGISVENIEGQEKPGNLEKPGIQAEAEEPGNPEESGGEEGQPRTRQSRGSRRTGEPGGSGKRGRRGWQHNRNSSLWHEDVL